MTDAMRPRVDSVELWEDLSHEVWHVQRGPGRPMLMTLDELDSAFKSDEIDASTLVRRPGSMTWRTLGAIAGLEPSEITLGSDSLLPVASDIDLTAIPKAPPLPTRLGQYEADRAGAYPLLPGETPFKPGFFGRAKGKLLAVGLMMLVGGAVFLGVSTWAKTYGPARRGAAAAALVAPAATPVAPPAAAPAEPPPPAEKAAEPAAAAAAKADPAPEPAPVVVAAAAVKPVAPAAKAGAKASFVAAAKPAPAAAKAAPARPAVKVNAAANVFASKKGVFAAPAPKAPAAKAKR